MVSGMKTGYHDYDKVPEFEKKVPEFEKASESDKKYLKKVGGHIGRKVEQITIKRRTIVRIIQIILRLIIFVKKQNKLNVRHECKLEYCSNIFF